MYALSTDESLEDYTGLTDDIVKQYFGCETVIALREKALFDIVLHRIVGAVYEQIILTSHMDFYPDDPNFKSYYSNRIASIDYMAKQENSTIPEFLGQNYQMTTQQFRESEIDFYVTTCILKELFKAENHPDMQPDINRIRSELAQEIGCSADETYYYFLNEDIFYSIAENKMFDLISEWYSTEICDAYALVKQSLSAIEK